MSRYVFLYAHDTSAGAAKTGDATNLSCYVTKDAGAIAAATNAPAEVSATNAAGWYRLELAEAERAADAVLVTAKSSTAGVVVEGVAVLSPTVEGLWTLRALVRLAASVLFGKCSGAPGTTLSFRDLADTKNRVSASVDSSGNRSAVTLDAS